MRLWQKFCLWPLIFFLSVFCGTGILLMEHNAQEVFQINLDHLMEEQRSIAEGINWYIYINSIRDSKRGAGKRNEYIKEFMENRPKSQGVYYQIEESAGEVGEAAVYTNLDLDLPVMETPNVSYTPQYKVLEYGERSFLRLTSEFASQAGAYRNTSFMDITDSVRSHKQQYRFFFQLFLAVAVLLTAGMYGISRHLTKSIRLLTDSVGKIGNGNFKARVEVRGRDEIGELALRYNEMAQVIEDKIAALEKTADGQRRFIDNFTHELRTPLTAVVGYGDLLRSSEYDGVTAQELGERIFRQGKRIEKLSELMLELVFLERHSFELVRCDLRELLMEAEPNLELIARNGQMRLELQLPEAPVYVMAEKSLLLNLMENLADNAKKASKAGDSIRIAAGTEAGYKILEVADHGAGIPEAEQSRVFETFYMVDKARNRKNNGVGLGLSICADIAKIHHARLELTSEVNVGTRIRIIFPQE